MKNILKRTLSTFLAAVIVFGAAPLAGFVGFFSTKAEAATTYTSGIYSYSVDESGNATIEECDTSATGDIIIPSLIDGYPVVAIGDEAFYACQSITSLEIPSSVKTICDGAFEHCTAKQIVINEGVEKIDDWGFTGCLSLVEISLPESLVEVGQNVFYYCTGLKYAEIPGSLKVIGPGMFNCCIALENVVMGEGVSTIHQGAFVSCRALTKIYIPESVSLIDRVAFDDCPSLSDVYYQGSEDDWNKIIINERNENLNGATIHFLHEHDYDFSVHKEATCEESGIMKGECVCGSIATEEIPAEKHTAGDWEIIQNSTYETQGKKIKKCVECKTVVEEENIPQLVIAELLVPTQRRISFGDGAELRVKITNQVPDGAYIEWSANNGNFSYVVFNDDKNCIITPESSGDTTFTVRVISEDGEVLAEDEQVMTSKAGLFDKIIGFFKKLFGFTKLYLS